MATKKKYKPLAKSRKNTSGRPSDAKREAMKREQVAKDRRAGKKVEPKKKERIAVGIPYKRQPLKALGPPRPLPDELMLNRRGIKCKTLLRNTPRLFINNAKYVRVLEIKKAKTKSGLTAYLGVCRTHDPARDKPPRKRNVAIIGLETDSGLPITRQRVLMQCDCENYVYTFEYANAAHNAARITYCNGQYPTFMNPQLAYGCCKHLVAFANYLILSDR